MVNKLFLSVPQLKIILPIIPFLVFHNIYIDNINKSIEHNQLTGNKDFLDSLLISINHIEASALHLLRPLPLL